MHPRLYFEPDPILDEDQRRHDEALLRKDRRDRRQRAIALRIAVARRPKDNVDVLKPD